MAVVENDDKGKRSVSERILDALNSERGLHTQFCVEVPGDGKQKGLRKVFTVSNSDSHYFSRLLQIFTAMLSEDSNDKALSRCAKDLARGNDELEARLFTALSSAHQQVSLADEYDLGPITAEEQELQRQVSDESEKPSEG